MRATLILAVVMLVVLFVVFAVLARVVLHGPVEGASLGTSVQQRQDRETPGSLAGGAPCKAVRGRWQCTVSYGSGTRTLIVSLRKRSSCWTARRRSQTAKQPALSGCVYLWPWTVF